MNLFILIIVYGLGKEFQEIMADLKKKKRQRRLPV